MLKLRNAAVLEAGGSGRGKWCPAQHREAVSPVNQFSPSRDTCWSVSRVTCHAQPRVLLSGDEY